MNHWPRRHLMLLPAAMMLLAVGAGAQQRSGENAPPFNGASSGQAMANQYCVACHSQQLKSGGVALDDLDWSNAGTHAPILEKVLRKVRTGEMPPPGMPRPPASTHASFGNWLENALDSAAAAHPNPGRPAIQRLNRAEYGNAVRDLLALDFQSAALLPVDDSGYGFDNIGDVLSTSPSLLQRYLNVSKLVSQLAVGDLERAVVEEEFLPRTVREERVRHDLPFNSRGGMAFTHYFPLDAEYVIRVRIGEDSHDTRLAVKAGPHTVGAAFIRGAAKEEFAVPSRRRGGGGPREDGQPPAELDLRLDGAKVNRFTIPGNPGAVERVLIAGPYNATGRGDTRSRTRIFVCRPANSQDEEPCARTILSTLARRAFRRPVTETDIRPLMAFYAAGRKEGDFDSGIERALRAMLVAPDFIFRVEYNPPGAAPGAVHRISDHELASRLSFFLWSSIPDDELLDLADAGKLKTPEVLERQVRRMLDDPRSDALVQNFAGQWLQLRNLAEVTPDPDVFSEFDDDLRHAIRRETELLFESILRDDRSVLDLLDSDYTFLNERLARHYDIPKVYGSQFRRIALSNPTRGGVLGHSSILTLTSNPNRTSVVLRGKWILENLLGTPPPPAPPDVPELEPKGKDGKIRSLREQMEEHRGNAVCASCHASMDPIGFALENYDGVGKWRTEENGAPIDASGSLPDGTQFEGLAGLKKLLLASRSDDFVSNVSEKLLTYGLGRGLEAYDMPVVRAIARDAARENYRMSALILAVVKSTPFQMRRTPEP